MRSVNLRCELNPPTAKSPAVLFPRCGRRLAGTAPTGPTEGMWSNKTRVFDASGGQLYEFFEDGTFSPSFGAYQIGTNPVTMRANGNQLVMCSAGNVYVATGTDFFQPIVNFASGTVDVDNFDVTRTSGDKFQTVSGDGNILPGHLFMIGHTVYTVATVTDDIHLSLTTSAGFQSGQNYQVGETLLYGATVEFIDGYFIVNVPNTKEFKISNLFDGTKWDELDKAQKNGSMDNIARVQDLSGYLALIGDNNSTEIWGDSGDQDFPFARLNGKSLNVGTAAAWSVAEMADGSLCWLASTLQGENVIVRTTGGAPQRISDHALENAMRGYSRVYDAIASSYLDGGHMCYRIDFPAVSKTWEFDATSNVWVELGVSSPADEVYDCEPGRFRVHVTWPSGRRAELAGDYASGKIWEVSPDFLDDDGVDFPVMRIAPHLNPNLERLGGGVFGLDCELGTIDPTALGADGKQLIPTVSMSYSDDGAQTWTDAGVASLGRVGEYDGALITPAEMVDPTPSSQTNPQVFQSLPMWFGLGSFRIARTYKIKSSGRMLRAVYNGLQGVEA